jgi:hypothetical protein
MTGSAKQSIFVNKIGLLRRFAPRNDGRYDFRVIWNKTSRAGIETEFNSLVPEAPSWDVALAARHPASHSCPDLRIRRPALNFAATEARSLPHKGEGTENSAQKKPAMIHGRLFSRC